MTISHSVIKHEKGTILIVPFYQTLNLWFTKSFFEMTKSFRNLILKML